MPKMQAHVLWLNRMRLLRAKLTNWLAQHWGQKFYVYLAVLFTVFVLLDTVALHWTSEIRTEAFDAMVSHRVVPTPADPDIVILNIDEVSLAKMSNDFGRWPWPREVMGKFVEQVEKQGPKAIVFDIMYSDPDVLNPNSDAYFNQVIGKTQNTYFPMLVVDTQRDENSAINVTQIKSATPLPDEEFNPDAKINVVLPYFSAVRDSGRYGTQNVELDSDGIERAYPTYLDEQGWKLPSLPTRIGMDMGWHEPPTQQMLLNWRGEPGSYHYISFADVFQDMLSAQPQRAQDEFKDKIIIIGSTAPNLFNLHATPMSAAHPGVEVLATAIDNYKNDNSLRFPEARGWYMLVTLLIIWVTAWAYFRRTGRDTIDKLFGLSQGALLVFAFASINFGNTFINLAGPLMIGIAYFSVSRVYAAATSKVLEKNMVRATTVSDKAMHATLMLIRFDGKKNVVSESMLEKLCDDLRDLGELETSVEALLGMQKGLWGLLEKTVAISWIADAEDEAAQHAIREDVARVIGGLPRLIKRNLLFTQDAASHVVHQGDIAGGEQAEHGWRRIYAEAMIQWGEEE